MRTALVLQATMSQMHVCVKFPIYIHDLVEIRAEKVVKTEHGEATATTQPLRVI